MKQLALVAIGGEFPSRQRFDQLFVPGCLIVAADSGLDNLRAIGIEPHFTIGDMDSIKASTLAGLAVTERQILPVDKDKTDTELAMEWARQAGADCLCLVGGGGGRLDHIFALRELFAKANPPDRWYTHSDEVVLIRHALTFDLPSQKNLSFFPVSWPCSADSRGLRWNLNGLKWTYGDFGISNRCETSPIYVTIKEGSMLMVRALNDGEQILPWIVASEQECGHGS